MKRKLWAWLVLLALLCAACQPTPTEEIIKNRMDGTMKSAILAQAAEPYPYEAPNVWKEDLAVREETVHIDAAIEVPEATMHPVYTIQTKPITVETCISLLEQALGQNLMIREQEISYEELLEELMKAERGRFAGEDDETGEPLWKPYEGQQEDIVRIQQQLIETPFEESYRPLREERLALPIVNRRIQTESGEKWYLHCNSGGITLSRNRKVYYQTEQQVLLGDVLPSETPHTLSRIGLSEAEAKERCEAYLNGIGRADLKVAELEKTRFVNDYTEEVLGEGYLVCAVTASEGCLPIRYGKGCGLLSFSEEDNSEDRYAAPWPQETVVLFITESGVSFMEWMWPKEIVLTANTNVRLLPFDEVQKGIRHFLEYGLRPGARESLHVERVVLTAAIQRIPDQGNEAFLIPVWAVFARSDTEIEQGNNAGCFLVNAIDGTYVGKHG